MMIFLGVMATLFGGFTMVEGNKDKRESYSLCFCISVLGMIAIKILSLVL